MPATVDLNLIHQLINLQQMDQAAAVTGLTGGPRPWLLPTPNAWGGDVLDIPGITQAFKRDDINTDYVNQLSGSGTVADLSALKIQLDYLAAYERAFRTRHASSVRLGIHAMARRAGHGQGAGIFGLILNHVSNLIAAGT